MNIYEIDATCYPSDTNDSGFQTKIEIQSESKEKAIEEFNLLYNRHSAWPYYIDGIYLKSEKTK